MTVHQFRPCPLCEGLASRCQLGGVEEYKKIMCQRCGTFILEPTLPAQAWARLAAEDMALMVVFLPAYIRRRNRRNHTPLLTLGNWRALGRRGRSGTRPPSRGR